jgi:hypothetical protein
MKEENIIKSTTEKKVLRESKKFLRCTIGSMTDLRRKLQGILVGVYTNNNVEFYVIFVPKGMMINGRNLKYFRRYPNDVQSTGEISDSRAYIEGYKFEDMVEEVWE